MKRIIYFFLGIVLALPVYVNACPLCTSRLDMTCDTPDCYYRHLSRDCSYSFSGILGQPFKNLLADAVEEWTTYASITMNEGGSKWQIWWEYDNIPTLSAATTTPTVNHTTGDIVNVTTAVYDTILNRPWEWSNTCNGVPPAYNLYKCLLHETGHALGLCLPITPGVDPHPTGNSVMETGSCYTELVKDTDGLCAIFLYQADPVSRCAEFTPVIQGGGVAVRWATEYEYETANFILDKQLPNGSFAPVQNMIIPVGSAYGRAEYEYYDIMGTLSDVYRLTEVDNNGIAKSIAAENVFPHEPCGSTPIVLTDMERSKLYSDIYAMINESTPTKNQVPKAPTSSSIEWLAIYPDTLSDAIGPLITYRDTHLYNASGITYEEILSQYGTIKAYLQHLWTTQSQSLQYVVIVGDDNLIPAERCTDGEVGDFYAFYYSDVITADLAGDWLPEVSIGRIPASSPDEVALYVAKALEYECQASADWNNHITFLIDDKDYSLGHLSGSVAAMFAQRLTDYIPSSHTLHYMSLLDNQPYDQCTQRSLAIDEFNDGRGMVLALGASANRFSLTDWLRTYASYGFSGCEFSGNQLSQNTKYAFVLGASCNIGAVTEGVYPRILKELLFQRYSGAIACFAPSGPTWQESNYNIAASILYYMYTYGTPTLGYACHQSQSDEMSHSIPGNAHTARSYLFYGDPAISPKGSIVNNPPVVTVSSPSAGDYYKTGQIITVNWHVTDEYINQTRTTILRKVDLITWDPIATNLTVDNDGYGTFNYRVPAYPSPYTDDCAQFKVFTRDLQNEEGSALTGVLTIEYLTKPIDEPIPRRTASVVSATFMDSSYPNPFNPQTTFNFGLKEPTPVELVIYDTGGRVVKTYYSGEILKQGIHTLIWDGSNNNGASVASGIYFLRFVAGKYSKTEKLVLLR